MFVNLIVHSPDRFPFRIRRVSVVSDWRHPVHRVLAAQIATPIKALLSILIVVSSRLKLLPGLTRFWPFISL
jgi:hypothetical protein